MSLNLLLIFFKYISLFGCTSIVRRYTHKRLNNCFTGKSTCFLLIIDVYETKSWNISDNFNYHLLHRPLLCHHPII